MNTTAATTQRSCDAALRGSPASRPSRQLRWQKRSAGPTPGYRRWQIYSKLCGNCQSLLMNSSFFVVQLLLWMLGIGCRLSNDRVLERSCVEVTEPRASNRNATGSGGEKDQSGSDCQISEWILHRHTPRSRGVSKLVPTRTAKCPIKNESTRKSSAIRPSALWKYRTSCPG